MKQKQTFLLVSDIDVEKTVFLNVKLNLFMNNFYRHIFRSSRFQMFMKPEALKNFAVFKIKKRVQQRVLSCKKQRHNANIL